MADTQPTPESPKRVFRQAIQGGPFYEVLSLLRNNPNWSVSGRVDNTSNHYVHWNSTTLELNAEGYLGDDTQEDVPNEDIESRAEKAVDTLRETMAEEIRGWNKDIEKELYAELEYQQSDDVLADWMTANEWMFDEEGERVDMLDFMTVDRLTPAVQKRVLAHYVDLFDRTPKQVMAALVKRKTLFDKRGNHVDTSHLVYVADLPDAIKSKVFDKYRNMLVEGDDFWAQDSIGKWTEMLEGLGFRDIDIRYSLGYSQGDGASFTSKSIDVAQMCEGMIKRQQTNAQVEALVTGLIE